MVQMNLECNNDNKKRGIKEKEENSTTTSKSINSHPSTTDRNKDRNVPRKRTLRSSALKTMEKQNYYKKLSHGKLILTH